MIYDTAVNEIVNSTSGKRRLSARDACIAIRKATTERLTMVEKSDESPSMKEINPARIVTDSLVSQ